MTRAGWWGVEVLSRLLEPSEREVVRGDIAESGESTALALRDIAGLVARRHVAEWHHWHAWAALLAVVVPLGMLLSLLARWLAETSAIYSFLYVNNWTWSCLTIPGARRDLFTYSARFLIDFASLACWSWTAGYVLGALSRRAVWVNGTLFVCILFGEFLLVPQHHGWGNAVVFDLLFYRAAFPALMRVVLVAAPLYWGIRRGCQHGTLPLSHALWWAVAVALFTVRAVRVVQMAAVLGWWQFDGRVYGAGVVQDPSWQLRLLPLALAWPAAYMLGTAGWRRWRLTST